MERIEVALSKGQKQPCHFSTGIAISLDIYRMTASGIMGWKSYLPRHGAPNEVCASPVMEVYVPDSFRCKTLANDWPSRMPWISKRATLNDAHWLLRQYRFVTILQYLPPAVKVDGYEKLRIMLFNV